MSQLAKLSMRARQFLPRLRLGLEVLLVVCIGLLAARMLWLFVEPGGAVSRPLPLPAMSPTNAVSSSATSTDLLALTRTNKFGAEAGPAASVPDAPATSLNLKLKGVRAVAANGDDTARTGDAIAIILTPDSEARTYHPGDTIIDGVTLDRVLADRVLIRKGGALETLMMESGVGALAVLSLPGQDGMIQGPSSPAVAASIDRNLLASLDIGPVFADGNLVGYRVTSPGSPTALSGSGLQSGDIITVIEGVPVTAVDVEGLADLFTSANEISLEVRRNGASLPLTLRVPKGD